MLQLLSEYEAVYKPSDSFLYMKAKYLENVLDKYKEAKELIKTIYKIQTLEDFDVAILL